MKKTWQAPRILVQEFETNEYVAACYSLYCKVAGDGKGSYGGYDVKFDPRGSSMDWGPFKVTRDGMWHGKPCAEGSSYDDVHNLFYENSKPGSTIDPNSVHIGGDAGDSYQYATWISHDVNGSGDYTHYGFAKAVDNRPNHS